MNATFENKHSKNEGDFPPLSLTKTSCKMSENDQTLCQDCSIDFQVWQGTAWCLWKSKKNVL